MASYSNRQRFGGFGFRVEVVGAGPDRDRAPRFDDDYLICVQLSGSSTCEVGGQTIRLTPGELAFANPKQVTAFAANDSESQIALVYCDRGVLLEATQNEVPLQALPEFTAVSARDPELDTELRDFVKRIDDDMSEGGASSGSRDRLIHALRRALRNHSNLLAPRQLSTNRVGHRAIARALEHIRGLGPDEDPTRITLDELASVAGLSKFHFVRQFDQSVGMTPGAYLRTLRLCRAAHELRTSGRPIVEVARKVGFSDHPSFSRAFSRHMGMSPREYQRMSRASG